MQNLKIEGNDKDSHDQVQEYVFKDLGKGSKQQAGSVLDGSKIINNESLFKLDNGLAHSGVIKKERQFAAANSFQISPVVKKHRGMTDQEKQERENEINSKVLEKFKITEQDAFNKGLEEGRNQGRLEVHNALEKEVQIKLELLNEMIQEVMDSRFQLLQNAQQDVYELIKDLTKWIVLKELKNDGKYIERLLEKLILELQTKSNLVIQVNKDNFDQMEEVLKIIETNLGKLTNVRVDIDHQINCKGLVVDSDNGIIDGTLNEQFKSLDKIFESVGLPFLNENEQILKNDNDGDKDNESS